MFSITTFRELLKGLPRENFDKLVQARSADKYSKGFRHWDHLVAMLYAQLSQAPGLRPLETGFNSHASYHYHLNTHTIRRSTLAEANQKRSDAVFADTAVWLMGQISRGLRKDSAELMYLLDSTSLTLKGREFDQWTLQHRTRHTQGIKVHILLHANTQTPQWHSLSAANINDVELATCVPLQAGALYVFDKGYCDYSWWHDIDQAGARFITRFKRNASLAYLEPRDIPKEAAGIVLADEIVKLKNRNPGGGRTNPYVAPLRRITVARPDKPSPLVLATNDMTSTAMEIAQGYKERWGIELFFKWVKQHLNIKSFLGRSENAVRIQVLTALICYLLLALYKQRNNLKESLWLCLVKVRTTLFQPIKTELHDRTRRRRLQEIALRQAVLF